MKKQLSEIGLDWIEVKINSKFPRIESKSNGFSALIALYSIHKYNISNYLNETVVDTFLCGFTVLEHSKG